MPSIVSVNALTAWLRRANDELKREHIHLEIGGDYFLDDMRLVCRSQGLATPVNSMQNQSPSLPDMLSQNNTGFLPAVDYSPGIHDINSHADIVTAGIALIDNALNNPRRIEMQQLRMEIPLETALSGVRTIDYPEGDLGKFFDELQSAGPGAIFLDLEGSKGSAIGISFLRSVADATNSGYNPPELDALRNMLDENLGNPLFKVVVTWVGATGHGSVWNNHTGTFKSILEDKDIHIYYMDDGPNSDFDRLASVMGSTREDIIDNLEVWNLRDITGFYDGTYTARPGYHPGLTALLGWHGLLCHKPKEKDYSQWEEDLDSLTRDMSRYLRIDIIALAVIGAFASKCDFTWTPRDNRTGKSLVGGEPIQELALPIATDNPLGRLQELAQGAAFPNVLSPIINQSADYQHPHFWSIARITLRVNFTISDQGYHEEEVALQRRLGPFFRHLHQLDGESDEHGFRTIRFELTCNYWGQKQTKCHLADFILRQIQRISIH